MKTKKLILASVMVMLAFATVFQVAAMMPPSYVKFENAVTQYNGWFNQKASSCMSYCQSTITKNPLYTGKYYDSMYNCMTDCVYSGNYIELRNFAARLNH